jgi:cytoskeletal protein RodZ
MGPQADGRSAPSKKRRKEGFSESVAQKSQVKLAFLQAIEEDALQLIPSETYVRGFIRS